VGISLDEAAVRIAQEHARPRANPPTTGSPLRSVAQVMWEDIHALHDALDADPRLRAERNERVR
jgi:hypothetical protein